MLVRVGESRAIRSAAVRRRLLVRARRATTVAASLIVVSSALPAGAGPIPWEEFEPNVPVVTPMPTPETAHATLPPPSPWTADELHDGFVVTPAGCADVRTAEGLDSFLRKAAGPVKGFDAPRITMLPDGRVIWLLQDTFLDYDAIPSTMTEMRYVNSVLLVQDRAGCFTALSHGDRRRARSFEPGTYPDDPWKQYWWPAGASAASGRLQVIWIEMTHDDHTKLSPLDGPAHHPVATWLAVYDVDTLERLSFEPAPNPGVLPIVGFDVVDDHDAGYSYLFGNTFIQNLSLEPVEPSEPHSATFTTLARVPIGRLDLAPEFWDGSGWSRGADAAQPIAQAGLREHIMLPQLIDGVWWSTTKPEGFLGDTVIVETAPAPQGPWTLWGSVPVSPHGNNPEGMVTYSPILMPRLDPDGEPIVVLSQIDPKWWPDRDDPRRYRPQAFTVANNAVANDAVADDGQRAPVSTMRLPSR